ncbi:MAG: hypothetical protein KAI16_01360 [Candidatus Pacebacteria bacterium]|nr:hypothetical protein [Candidatus Paceibacterota bacterium]
MKFLKNTKKDTQRGFMILISIVVSSLLLSIGMFIATISLKELQLSISAKTTQQAFFAADTAIECALYQDIRVRQFKINNTDAAAPTTILCNDETGINVLDLVVSESHGGADWAISVFEGSLADDQTDPQDVANSPYVKIKVEKFKIGTVDDKTTIEAWGHNRKAINIDVVERALKVEY